jgi:hypothetical protein
MPVRVGRVLCAVETGVPSFSQRKTVFRAILSSMSRVSLVSGWRLLRQRLDVEIVKEALHRVDVSGSGDPKVATRGPRR